jgi:beta-fructofuranosidase
LLNNWGNDSLAIAWGHATSTNLIDWTFDEKPALSPDQPYDFKGVFTGGFIPSTSQVSSSISDHQQSSPLVLAYTSVKGGGVTFKEPYNLGTETISLAQSYDHGATWQKYDKNPIVDGAPSKDVTGWRDPYISYWPAVDRLMGGSNNSSLYALISGGFHDRGPTTFLYKVDPESLTAWEYISPLIDIESNSRAGRWTGDVGKNWECVNRMTLRDPNSDLEREYLIISAEGTANSNSTNRNETASEALMVSRTPRHQLWMTGSLVMAGQKNITFTPSASGLFDHGNLYATNSFRHPVTGKLLAWGWLQEEDLPDEIRAEQGWSGVISLPREVYLQVHRNVSGHLGLEDISTIPVFDALDEANGNGLYSTMGIKIHSEVLQGLQSRATSHASIAEWRPRPEDIAGGSDSQYRRDIALNDTAQFILRSSVRYPSAGTSATVGITIVHDAYRNLYTEISYNPLNQTITVNRTNTISSNATEIEQTVNRRPESAAHTLLTYDEAGSSSVETLDIDILFDKSVLEIFVNERTVISTRIYVNGNSANGNISLVAHGEGAQDVVFENTGVWSGVDAEMSYKDI